MTVELIASIFLFLFGFFYVVLGLSDLIEAASLHWSKSTRADYFKTFGDHTFLRNRVRHGLVRGSAFSLLGFLGIFFAVS